MLRRPGASAARRTRRFNPHPPRRADAADRRRDGDIPDDVSILTRPEGRMLLWMPDTSSLIAPFQSSPAPKGGCCLLGKVFGLG